MGTPQSARWQSAPAVQQSAKWQSAPPVSEQQSAFVGPTQRMTFDPSEYDPSSPAFQAKYGPALSAGQTAAPNPSNPFDKGTRGEISDTLAGAGKSFADLGLAVRQMVGTGNYDEAKARRETDAPLMATSAGTLGNVGGDIAIAAPAAFVPGVNTVLGGAALGGALGALRPTEASGQRLVNAGVGAATGAATTYAANKLLGAASKYSPTGEPSTDAAKTLTDYGVPLDRSQLEGGRLNEKLRASVSDHPLTAGNAEKFYTAQRKAYNSAVLSRIGEGDAKEATQSVMGDAYRRIGSLFDGIGKGGAVWDDTLQNDVANAVSTMQRTVPESGWAPIKNNVDDILTAASQNGGKIPGETFIRIRRNLSDLSSNSESGQVAEQLENSLLDALERTNPGARDTLRRAVEQWRNMRIIQTAIGKGAERDISPARLANAIATKANQAMSVYGQGGDQQLVKLAQAGYEILPEQLPNSGTAGRSLMNAPLRALGTYPLYRTGQNYLLYNNPGLAAGGVTAPATGAANSLLMRQNALAYGR